MARFLGNLFAPTISSGDPSPGAAGIQYQSQFNTLFYGNAGGWGVPVNGARIKTDATAAYTLAQADCSNIIVMTSASANTVTLPWDSAVHLPQGIAITIVQFGAGQTTIAPAANVTLRGTPGFKLRAQYSACAVIKVYTDEWVVVGDLAA